MITNCFALLHAPDLHFSTLQTHTLIDAIFLSAWPSPYIPKEEINRGIKDNSALTKIGAEGNRVIRFVRRWPGASLKYSPARFIILIVLYTYELWHLVSVIQCVTQ